MHPAQAQMIQVAYARLPPGAQAALRARVSVTPPEHRPLLLLSSLGLLRAPAGPPGPVVIEREPLGDDFDLRVDAYNRAAVAPDGSRLSELSALATMRDQEWRALDADVQKCFVNPPSARRGTLGNTAYVNNGGAPKEVINWVADRDDESTAMTVTLSPIQDVLGNIQSRFPGQTTGQPTFTQSGTSRTATVGPVSTGVPQNRGFANVRWSNRGVPHQAQVDVGKGCQFSLSGSSCVVEVGLDAGNSTGAMGISGSLGFFSAQRPAPVTRTIYAPLTNASSTNYIIPAYARQLLPPQRSFAAAGAADGTAPTGLPFQLDFFDINSNYLYSLYGGDTAYSFATGPTPLSDDAYSVTVLNKSPSTAFTVRLIFELGF